MGQLIHAVVFDFDGVLVDSNDIKTEAYKYIFKDYIQNSAFREKKIMSLVEKRRGKDRFDIIHFIISELNPSGSNLDSNGRYYEGLCQDYGSYCERRVIEADEIVGAGNALEELKNYRLFINSATPDEPLKRALMGRKIASHFEKMLGSSGSKSENLVQIMNFCKIGPENIVFVGDAESDFLAARDTGCHFIGVENKTNEFKERLPLSAPDLLKLPELVNSFNVR